MEKTDAPTVFNYLEVTHYLQDHFTWRKGLDPKFSYSAWADELQLGSKTILRFILRKQRNISPKTSAVLRSNLRLVDSASEYFDLLVSYSQVKSHVQKQALGAALLRLHRQVYSAPRIEAEVASQDVLGPIVLTLLTFTDVKNDPENLAQLLGVSELEIFKVLEQLSKNGLLKSNAAGASVFPEKSFRIPDALGSQALKKFHSYWLDEARKSIQLPVETRRFRSLKFALSPEEFTRVTEALNEFAISLLSRFHCDSLEGRRLYMLESALFPLTRETPQPALVMEREMDL